MTNLFAKLKAIPLIMGMLMFSLTANAQSSVQGKVVDQQGEPVVGAAVIVNGTTTGTITNGSGEFSVNLPRTGSELTISYLGYVSKTVNAATGTYLSVTLEEDNLNLDAVVVTGYGTMKKGHLTGAVASVKSDQLSARPVADVGQALAGQIAGVNVGSVTSPGATPSIVIRGYRSISNNRSPLYVVDGIPREDYNDIPVSDIASVEVLKDAISAAIYGSRAANGVILITTKGAATAKGQHKVEVGFSGFYGINQAQLPDMMTGDEYVDYYRVRKRWIQSKEGEKWFTNGPLPDDQVFTTQEFPTVQDKRYVNWESMLYKKSVASQEYGVYVDNIGENSKIRFSANYRNDEGYYPNSDFSRLSLGLKADQKFFKIVDFSSTIRYTNSVRNSVDPGIMQSNTGTYDIFRYLNPLIQCYDSDGTLIEEVMSPYANPMLDILYPPTDRQTDHRLFSVFNFKVNLFKGLTFTSNFGWDARFRATDIFYPKMSTKRFMLRESNGAYGERGRNTRQGFTFDNYFNYTNTFAKKHTIDATVVQSIQSSISDGITMQGENLPDDVLGYWNMRQFSMNEKIKSDYYKTTLSSFIGRFQYTYANKYMANFSVRQDGSSVLSPGHKWGVFPAGSVAWVITKENFFDVKAVSLLKLRASYGTVGSATVDPYQSYGEIYDVRTNFGNDMATGYALSNINGKDRPIPNKTLTWEKSTTLNIGLDWGLFAGRLSGYVECYKTITTDLIFTAKLPNHSGFTETTENVGSTLNRGIEANLSSVNISSKNFKWTTDINFSTNEGVVRSLKWGVDQPDNKLWIGKPWRTYYDNIWTGIWQIDDPDLATYVNGTGTKPGLLKYKDISGPDGVQDGVINEHDKVILGVRDPKWMMFVRNTFQYKGFSLSVGLNGKFGNMIQMSGRGWGTGYPLRILNDYWSPDNPTGKYNLIAIPGNDIDNVQRYRPGDYIRVQELSLNYRFKTKAIKEMNVGVISNNPCYLYRKAKDCIDPSAPDMGWQTWKSVALRVDVKF